jgi:Zn-dependent protease
MLHDNAVVDVILFILVLLPSVILHEIAHGALALRLGDPTARDAGRLTLNPVPHIDPLGTVLLPTMLALAGARVFGWAKPVPVNPARFGRPVEGMAATALAGPATNLAIVFLVGRFGPFVQLEGEIYYTSDSLWAMYLLGLLIVNAALAVFNMLPIPPLDGSRLLPLVLGQRGRIAFEQVSQYGFLLLVVLLFVFPRSLAFLGTAIRAILRLAV